MRHLLFMRHAKAERSGKGSGRDFDRVLSDRGMRDAEEMGGVIAKRGETIDLVLCSASERTRQTWHGVRSALRKPPEAKFMREIYDGQASYLDVLRNEAGNASTVLLIGHNPSIQETAILLAEDLSSPEGATLKSQFPTAALAVLEIDGGWEELAPGTARLAAFVRPRESERD